MTMTNRAIRFTAAAFIGVASAAVALQPAFSEEIRKPDETLVDTRTTGSVAPAGTICNPNDPGSDIVCKVTRGQRDVHFPSAPVNPAFGF